MLPALPWGSNLSSFGSRVKRVDGERGRFGESRRVWRPGERESSLPYPRTASRLSDHILAKKSPHSPKHALLPAPLSTAPTLIHLFPSLSQTAAEPGDSTFPSAPLNKPLPRLPSLDGQTPQAGYVESVFSSHLFTLVYLVFDAGVDPTCYITVCRAHFAGK